MSLDYRTVNSLWASILVETLARLGLRYAIICPGSRSTPLTMAFAAHPLIDAIPVLDERSGAFWALGLAKRTRTPIPVVCTSGTAAANFYPAVIEAHESGIPLLILSTDRPALVRECHSGQTIDQSKLFGTYPVWQVELGLPTVDPEQFDYVRQLTQHAHERALTGGAVHLNIPFDDPLAPTGTQSVDSPALNPEREAAFFAGLHPAPPIRQTLDPHWLKAQGSQWQACPQGLIIAGEAQPLDPAAYAEAVGSLSQRLGWPVLAESLSPLRNHQHHIPALISTYDLLLRDPELAQRLQPQQVIQIGPLHTSKVLRAYLKSWDPLMWLVDEGQQDLDPLRNRTQPLKLSIQDLAQAVREGLPELDQDANQAYRDSWIQLEQQAHRAIDDELADQTHLFEGRIPWLLSQIMPADSALFVANSNPIRDLESFWSPNDRRIRIFCNRGANGIDGTLSTALGVAHDGIPTFFLTGDLALLHDTNGFLTVPKFKGSLTIVLINNHGGGIFEMLPISGFEPPFEEYFVMPQAVNFSQLCQTYGVAYQQAHDWHQFQTLLKQDPPAGVRLIEIETDRKADTRWRKTRLHELATQVRQSL